MPKTYNSRQVRDMKMEARFAPPLAASDEPDVTPYIRPFPPEEIAALERITARVAAGKVAQLKPENRTPGGARAQAILGRAIS